MNQIFLRKIFLLFTASADLGKIRPPKTLGEMGEMGDNVEEKLRHEIS